MGLCEVVPGSGTSEQVSQFPEEVPAPGVEVEERSWSAEEREAPQGPTGG